MSRRPMFVDCAIEAPSGRRANLWLKPEVAEVLMEALGGPGAGARLVGARGSVALRIAKGRAELAPANDAAWPAQADREATIEGCRQILEAIREASPTAPPVRRLPPNVIPIDRARRRLRRGAPA